MTNEEMLGVADIVERATNRFNAQAALHRERFDEHVKLIASMNADHDAKLVEHRAAFGARTEADAKIIAGLRSEIGAARMAVLERDSLISERAKLQSIINEQSASAKEAGEKLGWSGNESAIQAVERVVKERDGLLTQVQDMRAEMERLRAQMSEQEVSVVGIINERNETWERFWAEVARLKSQTPKQHPAKVAAWVRRTDEGYPDAPTGYMAQVLSVTYRVRDQSGSVVFWYSSFCEPCDPPQTEPVPKRAHPVTKGEYVKVSNGAVTQVLEVHKDWYLVSGGHGWTFANCSPYDPPEATHDTEAGKAAAEAALKTEPVAEEIKVGDLVEVKQ